MNITDTMVAREYLRLTGWKGEARLNEPSIRFANKLREEEPESVYSLSLDGFSVRVVLFQHLIVHE